jgi:hypothetical protein
MLNYIGNGEHKIGIPARDLNDEEVAELGGEEVLIATGLYAKPAKVSRKAAANSKDQSPEISDPGKEA